jgi:hypothetical protein
MEPGEHWFKKLVMLIEVAKGRASPAHYGWKRELLADVTAEVG